MIRRLDTADAGFEAAFAELIARDARAQGEIDSRVGAIIDDVRARGDQALLDYTRDLDGYALDTPAALEIPATRLQAALNGLDNSARAALETAVARITRYAEAQKLHDWQITDEYGSMLGQLVRPLEAAGIYVPGGKAAYPSSVLMNAIPAKVAGVDQVIMVSPAPRGELNDWVLAAAALAGVDRFFTVGGAQAIAALAWGTSTIPGVDKIVGPGNAYVAAAKRQVFGHVGIEAVAGPSEVLIIADGSGDPQWTALDLFAQAEHDELARALAIAPDAAWLDAVAAEIERLLPEQPRAEIIRAALAGQGALIRARDLDQALALSNRVAPEHLELAVAEPRALLAGVRHAGAVFMGHYTPEAFGDYCAGSNHVLPTARTARFSSALGVYDFQRRLSVLETTAAGAQQLAAVAAVMADAEGLHAHARSARVRARSGTNANAEH